MRPHGQRPFRAGDGSPFRMATLDANFADVWEAAADASPNAPALVNGGVQRTWSDFDQRADGVAATLIEGGLRSQDKVAQYLFNSNEYLEAVFATFKAGLVPVNTNYRYGDRELVYLWEN